jgi:hypothetical protein
MSKIISAERSKELLSGWSICLRLHSNFYEGFMTEEDVKISLEEVEKFVKDMIKLLTT